MGCIPKSRVGIKKVFNLANLLRIYFKEINDIDQQENDCFFHCFCEF